MTVEAREIAKALLDDLHSGRIKVIGIDLVREHIRAHKHYRTWSRSNVEFLETKVCRIIVSST